MHRFDPRTELEETLRGLELLVQSGKILYPAVSNFASYQAQRALDVAERAGLGQVGGDSAHVQPAQASGRSGALAHGPRQHVGVLPYSPLAAGLLSGKYSGERAPSEGRMLTSKNYQVRYAPATRAVWPAEFHADCGAHGCARSRTRHRLGRRTPGRYGAIARGAQCCAAQDLSWRRPRFDSIQASTGKSRSLTPTPAPATDRNDDGTEHDLWSAESKRALGRAR